MRFSFPLLFVLCVLTAAGSASEIAPGTLDAEIGHGLALLDEGNELSESNMPSARARYREAAAVLDRVRITHALHNAQLNHAIGNAYLKSDELGHAVLAYKRANTLDPTDAEIRGTLAHARSLVGSQAPSSRRHRVLDWLLAWRGHLARPLLWWSSTALFFGGWVLIAAKIWRGGRLAIPLAAACIGLSAAGFVGIWLDAWDTRSQHGGVILEDAITARTGPSARVFDAAFQEPLPAGVEFVMVDQRDGWVQIQLASNALGWVPRSSVGFVVAPEGIPSDG